MSRLSKEMENWRLAELRHAALFGKAAIRTKSYQKIRLAEMQRIYRDHRVEKLSLDDNVRLRMLRSGNRHLEGILYPNRIVRYIRRVVRFSARILIYLSGEISRRMFPSKYVPDNVPVNNAKSIALKSEKNKAIPTKIIRLPKKIHQPVDIATLRRGRSI